MLWAGLIAVEAPHPNVEANLALEGREIRPLPDIGTVNAAAEVPTCGTAAVGTAVLDHNDEGALTQRGTGAHPASGG